MKCCGDDKKKNVTWEISNSALWNFLRNERFSVFFRPTSFPKFFWPSLVSIFVVFQHGRSQTRDKLHYGKYWRPTYCVEVVLAPDLPFPANAEDAQENDDRRAQNFKGMW